MSRAERKARWRAKKRAAWQAECAEHGPLWEAVGGKPVTLDDLARVSPSAADLLPPMTANDEPHGAK
jgi:hypothetical protein